MLVLINTVTASEDPLRSMKYTSRTKKNATVWQHNLRSQLSGLLKLNDILPGRKNIPFEAKELLAEDRGNYIL